MCHVGRAEEEAVERETDGWEGRRPEGKDEGQEETESGKRRI